MKRTAIALKIPRYQRDHGLFCLLDIFLSRCTMASANSMQVSVQKSLNSFDYCSSFANHWMSFFSLRWCELRDTRKQFGCL
jgi:hypothetical protein